MTSLEKRLARLEESQSTVNARTLTDAERVVRIAWMDSTGAPGCERVRELLTRSAGITWQSREKRRRA
jgi:hypothetical protein